MLTRPAVAEFTDGVLNSGAATELDTYVSTAESYATLICHDVSTLVPVNTSTVTVNVSPPYTGLLGSRAYPPTADSAGAAGAATTVNAAADDTATCVPPYAIDTATDPVEPAANQPPGTVYWQLPTPAALALPQAGAALLAPAVTASVAVKPDATVLRPTASTTEYTSHSVALSTYTVAVLRMARTDAAWLAATEYDALDAALRPPEMVSPPTNRLSDPLAPTAALKKAPNDCVVTGSVAVAGSGFVRAGAGRLAPSPTAEPDGRRLTPLSQKISGPLTTPTELRVADGEELNKTVLVVAGVPLDVADKDPAAVTEEAEVAEAVALFETEDVGDAAALLEAVFEPEGVPLEIADAETAPDADTEEVAL